MPQHLDYRNNHFRGTYWNKPQPPEEGLHSPSKSETLRGQKLNQQSNADNVRGFKATSSPGHKLNSSLDRFPQDQLTKKMHESSGSARSLPTQLADKPTTVNVNHLRAQREETIWKGYINGARTFDPKTNVDNFIEERFDVSYLDGNSTHLFKRAYESVASASAKEATQPYQQRVTQSTMFAKQADPNKDHRSIHRHRPNYVNYAHERDFTPASTKKGAFWVGTAPTDMYETSNMAAYGLGKKHEFQYRSPSTDTKSRMLCGIKTDHRPEKDTLDAYREKWTHHNGVKRSEKSWGSEYTGKFTDFTDIAESLDTRRTVVAAAKTDVATFGVQGAGAFL
mmetsp:Transcript_20287/g.24243  ORF Transcript_20287/g.24243 Transcript_20287/m.24243 type:complete len:338 (-) Transcript_20287:484-1497(-)|eukprot:CAMPEP_0197852408 /NCGR_PEP_ID=MMETSP1438-20131217/20526_1 /TAXON_ID=1461541 /ORGANISM="Pterosperma sp., Strain CCMP1384" /LENGTH=337 /DNA_ID=CAMNT_0043466459 /DNA_START=143 /DNA_END=1156 /DNA_ORIENTATION=+